MPCAALPAGAYDARTCRVVGYRPSHRRRARPGRAGRGAGNDDRHPRHAVSAQRGHGARGRGARSHGGGGAGDDRDRRRTDPGGARTGGHTGASRHAQRAQGEPRRSAVYGGSRRPRRHDGRGDDDLCGAGRHRRLRDGRNRRRSSRGRGDIRRFGRSRRTRAHAGRRRLRGRESTARPAQDARSSRDAGRPGDLLPQRRFPGVLEPQQRLARAAAPRFGRPRSRLRFARNAPSATRAARWSRIPSTPAMRFRPARSVRTSRPRSPRRTRGYFGERRHAVSPRPPAEVDRRPQSYDQHRFD